MAVELVTSENREEYNAKKMAQKRGERFEPEENEETERKSRAKKMDNEQYERAKKHPKFASLKAKFGKRDATDMVLKLLNEAQ